MVVYYEIINNVEMHRKKERKKERLTRVNIAFQTLQSTARNFTVERLQDSLSKFYQPNLKAVRLRQGYIQYDDLQIQKCCIDDVDNLSIENEAGSYRHYFQ